MPPCSLELAAGAIIFYTCAIKLKLFILKRLYYFYDDKQTIFCLMTLTSLMTQNIKTLLHH